MDLVRARQILRRPLTAEAERLRATAIERYDLPLFRNSSSRRSSCSVQGLFLLPTIANLTVVRARVIEQWALYRDRFLHRPPRRGNEAFRRARWPSHPQFGALWQWHPRYLYNGAHGGPEFDVHSLIQNDSAALMENADAALSFPRRAHSTNADLAESLLDDCFGPDVGASHHLLGSYRRPVSALPTSHGSRCSGS